MNRAQRKTHGWIWALLLPLLLAMTVAAVLDSYEAPPVDEAQVEETHDRAQAGETR